MAIWAQQEEVAWGGRGFEDWHRHRLLRSTSDRGEFRGSPMIQDAEMDSPPPPLPSKLGLKVPELFVDTRYTSVVLQELLEPAFPNDSDEEEEDVTNSAPRASSRDHYVLLLVASSPASSAASSSMGAATDLRSTPCGHHHRHRRRPVVKKNPRDKALPPLPKQQPSLPPNVILSPLLDINITNLSGPCYHQYEPPAGPRARAIDDDREKMLPTVPEPHVATTRTLSLPGFQEMVQSIIVKSSKFARMHTRRGIGGGWLHSGDR